MSLRSVLAALVASITTAVPLAGLTAQAQIVAVKVTAPPAIDGTVTGAPWDSALRAADFFDFTTRAAATLDTKAFLAYDDRNVYVAFDCAQPSVPIKTSGNQNDLAASVVDYVELQIDPSGNGARIYRFDATPNGLRYQYSSESTRYSPSWTAAGKLAASGYSVTMAIPIAALRVQAAARQSWRINFVRHVADLGEDLTWSYDPGMTDLKSDSRYWARLDDIRLAQQAHRPSPYADVFVLESGGHDRAAFGSRGVATREPRVGGIDVNVPLTPTAAFVATVNPDFSNVDKDQFTIAPQEFQLALREYRPFFAQGQNYVSPLPFAGVAATNVQPFYTPNIGVFDRGVKIEGTQGLNQFGLLNVTGESFNDSAFGYSYISKDQATQIALQDVVTHHLGASDSTFGVSLLRQNPRSGIFANAELIANRGTNVTDPGAANAKLFALGIHNSRWNAGVQYEDIGPQFAPLDGYVANNDVRGPYAFVDYTGVPSKNSWLKSYELQVYGDRFLNRAGGLAEADGGWYASARTKSQLTFTASSSISQLSQYAGAYPAYGDTVVVPFHLTTVGIGYKDGTASPIDVSYGWGPFTVYCSGQSFCGKGTSVFPSAYVEQPFLAFARQLGQFYSLGFTYAGTVEHTPLGTDSQWLRRISVARALGKRGSVNIALRTISGNGGYSVPGTNLSAGLDLQFRDLSHLYVEYGSPSSVRTLNRVLVKYVFHVAGGPRN
jgi:hypothetical protein